MKKEESEPRFYSMTDCMEGYKKENERYQKFLENNFTIDESGFDLRLPSGHPYGIEWERIDTPEKILYWIDHMLGKEWFLEDPLFLKCFLNITKRRLEEKSEKKKNFMTVVN